MIKQHNLPAFDELEIQPQPAKIIISALAAMTQLPLEVPIPPVLLRGSPGVGKSQFMTQLARALNIPYIAASAIMFSTDWIAIPTRGTQIKLDENTSVTTIEYAYPQFLFHFIQQQNGIFIIDELDKLPKELMAAFLGILSERRIGYLTFPPRVFLIGAINPIGCGGYQLLDAALANRFIHLTFTSDTNELIHHLRNLSHPSDKCFYNLFAYIPPDIFQHNFRQLASLFAQFLKNYPNIFENPSENWNEEHYAYTTPRSFIDLALPALTALLSAQFRLDNVEFIVPITSHIVLTLLENSVGQKTATLLFQFLTTPKNELDVVTILSNPELFPYGDFDKRFHCIDSIAQYFNNHPDIATLDKITNLLAHLLDNLNDESLASLLLTKIRKSIRKLAKSFANHEAFKKFVNLVARHQHIFYQGENDG